MFRVKKKFGVNCKLIGTFQFSSKLGKLNCNVMSFAEVFQNKNIFCLNYNPSTFVTN